MGSVLSVSGFRIPLATVIGMVAEGMSHEEIIKSVFIFGN